MRTIIALPPDQLERLDAWRRTERVSRAEAIRRAVAAHLERVHPADAATRAFGLFRKRPIDALRHERRLRREWDRPGGR